MKSQRGNIIVYLLVGVVLFGLLLGSAWWIKNRYTVAQSDKQPTEVVKPEVKQDDTSANTPAAPQRDQGSDQQQTGSRNSGGTNQAPSTSETPRTGPSPSAVAASGPTENFFISASLLGLITYQASAFMRSRQPRH